MSGRNCGSNELHKSASTASRSMKETLPNEEFVSIVSKIFSGGQCVYVVLVVNDIGDILSIWRKPLW